ncbi:MAG TPA: tetratricopeptide repeat protein [Pyrinomonadaceae bacterium]|nr:tetratricopeptide repeat protein [Pyrinomonadaceae bacterium]
MWYLRRGADAKEGRRRLAQDSASVDTFRALVAAERNDDALVELKRVLEAPDVAQTIAALRAFSETIFSFQHDQTRSYTETIRQAIASARARIAQLPREDAARLAREMLLIDQWLEGRQASQQWPERLTQFVRDYDGTEAALLTQVDLLMSDPRQMLKQIGDLDQFAKDHPRTNAAAKALFQEAFQLQVNVPITGLEPRGSDPTDRLLRVAAIVKELESGKYPRSEWVEKAPELLIGFFVSETPPPRYSPANIERAIETYADFVRTHLQMPNALLSMDNSLGYVIASKMGNLFELKGDRIGGIERFLDDLEKTASDPGSVQLFRAQYYARQSSAGPEADRESMAAKARAALTTLVSANRGDASRRALAFAAAFDYYQRDYARALPEYQKFVLRYPSSSWAPIAALRIGECYEQMKDWPKASAAYNRAASSFANDAYARVLGGAFASRTLDAQGRFDDSLSAAKTALNSWDADYGFEYSILSPQAPLSNVITGPVVDSLRVTRDDLAARVATLDHDLRQSGGRLLARARWQLDQNQFTEAINTLTTFLKQEPRSPALVEARSLLHRAQLETVLDLAAVEGAHYDPAKALAALDAIAKEPFDSFVATAALAKAALRVTQGQSSEAEALMEKTLDSWVATQRDLNRQPPTSSIDADVAEIRQVVFRPLGDLPIYSGSGWNDFNFPAALPRFIVVRADVQVKTADGQVSRHTVYQQFPDLDHVLLLKSDELSLLARLLPTIGGTKRRAPTQIMETPNQPVGDSMQILSLFEKFFQARPGHWGGWVLETYPQVTQIEFVNAERTKANANVTIGYSGATVVLEKVDGKWRAVRLTNQWIT